VPVTFHAEAWRSWIPPRPTSVRRQKRITMDGDAYYMFHERSVKRWIDARRHRCPGECPGPEPGTTQRRDQEITAPFLLLQEKATI